MVSRAVDLDRLLRDETALSMPAQHRALRINRYLFYHLCILYDCVLLFAAASDKGRDDASVQLAGRFNLICPPCAYL